MLADGVPLSVFQREMQQYRDALVHLRRQVATLEGRDVQRNLGFGPALLAATTAPAPSVAVQARERAGATLLQLRALSSNARVVDLADAAGKALWLERAKELRSFAPVATQASDALRAIGAVPVDGGGSGGVVAGDANPVARVSVRLSPLDEALAKSSKRVVRVMASLEELRALHVAVM